MCIRDRFTSEARLELLKDLPLEKIKTDSSMLVFPEPFLPKKKFIPGESCKSTFLKHLKLLIEIFVKDTFR